MMLEHVIGVTGCYWGFMKRFFHPGRFCGTKTKLTMNRNLIIVWCTVAANFMVASLSTLKLNQSRELVKAKAMTRFFA
jgi:hypothetical protein